MRKSALATIECVVRDMIKCFDAYAVVYCRCANDDARNMRNVKVAKSVCLDGNVTVRELVR
jgi:hypothetical protein